MQPLISWNINRFLPGDRQRGLPGRNREMRVGSPMEKRRFELRDVDNTSALL
jgi:hypothetical protein